MGDNIVDEAKGRVKEAAGSLADDSDLKREGKIDQAKADVKDKIDSATDKVEELAEDKDD